MVFLVWALTAFYSLFQFFLQISGNMMASNYIDSFHLSAAGLGSLSSAMFYGYILVQIPAGFLFDRFQLRRVLLSAVLTCAIGCALFSFSHSLWLAIPARFLMGIGAGFGFIGMVFASSRCFPSRYFILMVGIGELIGMLGTSAAQAVIPHIVIHVGWRTVLLACAMTCFFLWLLMFALLKQDFHIKGKHLPQPNQQQKPKLLTHLHQTMRIPNVWFAGIFCLGMFSVVTIFAALWGAPFLVNTHQLSYLQATTATASLLLGIAIGGPAIGWINSHSQHPKRMMISAGLITLICALITLFYTTISISSLNVLMFIFGFFSCSYLLGFSLVEHATSSNIRGTAIGFCNAIAVLGGPVLQPSVGWLLDQLQHQGFSTSRSYQYSLLLLGMVIILGVIAASLVKTTKTTYQAKAL